VRKLPKNVLPDNQLHDLDIRTEALGDALARTFSVDSEVNIFSFDSASSSSNISAQVVLMRYGKPHALNER
jgi:hypothetical protein